MNYTCIRCIEMPCEASYPDWPICMPPYTIPYLLYPSMTPLHHLLFQSHCAGATKVLISRKLAICQQLKISKHRCLTYRFDLKIGSFEKGAARTRAPAATNYDVHSPAWGDARANSPSGSAMEAPALSHRPCWSPIDPAQVSMFICCSHHSLYTSLPLRPLYVGYIHRHTLCVYSFSVLESALLLLYNLPIPSYDVSLIATSMTYIMW